MIELNQGHFIAMGIYCKCFENPLKMGECIKIPIEGRKAQKRLRADIKYYRKLHKKSADLSYIADYFGECQTSMGIGYRYECVRDYDSKVSRRLEYYLENTEISRETLYNQMGMLAYYLVENKILISDLHARNILIKLGDSGEITPMIVDGIGDRVAIEVLNLLPGAIEAKIARRWNRFAHHELGGKSIIE